MATLESTAALLHACADLQSETRLTTATEGSLHQAAKRLQQRMQVCCSVKRGWELTNMSFPGRYQSQEPASPCLQIGGFRGERQQCRRNEELHAQRYSLFNVLNTPQSNGVARKLEERDWAGASRAVLQLPEAERKFGRRSLQNVVDSSAVGGDQAC